MNNFRFLLFFSDVKSTAIIFIQSFDKYVVCLPCAVIMCM